MRSGQTSQRVCILFFVGKIKFLKEHVLPRNLKEADLFARLSLYLIRWHWKHRKLMVQKNFFQNQKGSKSSDKLSLYLEQLFEDNSKGRNIPIEVLTLLSLAWKLAHTCSATAKSHYNCIAFIFSDKGLSLAVKREIEKILHLFPTSTRFLFEKDLMTIDAVSAFDNEVRDFYHRRDFDLTPYALISDGGLDLSEIQERFSLNYKLIKYLVIIGEKGRKVQFSITKFPLWSLRLFLVRMQEISLRSKALQIYEKPLPEIVSEVEDPRKKLTLDLIDARIDRNVPFGEFAYLEFNILDSARLCRFRDVLVDARYGIVSCRSKILDDLIPIELDSAVLIPTGNPHHSHFIFETLSKLYLLPKDVKSYTFLASSVLVNSQIDYLKSLGISDERVLRFSEKRRYKVRELLTLEGGNFLSKAAINFLLDQQIKPPSNATSSERRVFFSRSDSRNYRNLVNEEECIEIFKKFDFDVIEASKLTASEKLRLCSSASVIAGPLGAAFHYASFMPKVSTISLTSGVYLEKDLEFIWRDSQSSLILVGSTLLEFDENSGAHSSFVINPEVLEDSLIKFFEN